MAEPFQAELQEAVDKAGRASQLDDAAGVALAGSFYKDFTTGRLASEYGAGWDTLKVVSPPGGYDGAALYHPASRSLVILNRGTEGLSSLPDWMQNVGSALFDAPGRQLADALELLVDGFNAAGGGRVDRILICGHSLGGALADAQGALAESLFASRGLTCPPVRVVGVASAGFAGAARKLAAQMGLQPSATADQFITHYVRRKDVVPNHPRRAIFGADRRVASVYEARQATPPGPHAVGVEWRLANDIPKQHKRTLYFKFLDQPATSHIWFSRNTGEYAARTGQRPPWTRRLQQPADW